MGFTTKVEVFDKHNVFEFLKDPELLEQYDIYTIKEFREMVADGTLIDYDGFGCPINAEGYKHSAWFIIPSQVDTLTEEVAYIEWYNK